MDFLKIRRTHQTINGTIDLDGSKSISNRVQIIRAICAETFPIENLSTSDDSVAMLEALANPTETIDVGAAGTTFRFLTSYLSTQPGTQILTGSERMKNRPIGSLVSALNELGASIEYLEKEGYPPLKIGEGTFTENNELNIPASISSQFISALLLIAPSLPNGIVLNLVGKIVSVPYILMTLELMQNFGIQYEWEGNTITVKAQAYEAKPFFVESDWSAASYYYSLISMADVGSTLTLKSLQEKSLQGDCVIAEIGKKFGIRSTFDASQNAVLLEKTDYKASASFEWDFIKCPDIAQTVAVMCAATGISGLFTGLETLRIKETDRIAALSTELGKVNAFFNPLPKKFSSKSAKEYFLVEGKASFEKNPTFETYEDHRMAMAFAPFAMFSEISFEEPSVVAKSYPQFWEDLKTLGFEIH